MRPEHWLFTIPLRLRSLFRWAQADQELDDELRDHLERKTDEYIAQGMTQEEAHRRARLDLGGVEKVKQECRDARRVSWFQDFAQDIRYGLRILRFEVVCAIFMIATSGFAPLRLRSLFRCAQADSGHFRMFAFATSFPRNARHYGLPLLRRDVSS
jgi:hypothetical protein